MLIDTVTYTSLIHWVSSSGDVDGAMRLWEEMRDNGCEPTVVSYTAYMKILFADGRVEEATEVYKDMLRSRVSPNCHTYTVLMEYLVGTGQLRSMHTNCLLKCLAENPQLLLFVDDLKINVCFLVSECFVTLLMILS